MPSPRSSELVDSLFARLTVRYGSAWLNRWAGVDMNAVKADWAAELAPFFACPEAIRHALENLPADQPPTVGQFKALCVNRPRPAVLALPGPKPSEADKERVRSLLAKARSAVMGAGQ